MYRSASISRTLAIVLLNLPAASAVGEEDPAAKPATIAELEKELRAPRPETRRAAVKKLAARDERAAWELVLGALEDREPEVADEAQVALGALKDARLIRELDGRLGLCAKDPWVRLRVAEAFGRMPVEVDGEALARALAPQEVELSRTLLWSIERLAGAKRLAGERGKIARAAERIASGPGEVGLRGAALATLAALDPLGAHPLVLELLEAREPGLRCAALAVVGSSTEQECLTISQAMLGDPAPAVRVQAAENLEKLGSKAAILALVRAMEVEERARLKWRILGWLRGISGLEHGFDVETWRTWAGSIEGRWSTGDGSGAKPGEVGDGKASLAGLDLISDRVCFLVDFSGSTWDTKVGELTRKQVLDRKLRTALEALPEGTLFNLVPYTNEPIPWEKRLVPSTKANVKRAIEWFERCHQNGRGNFFDAAVWALADPEVDTIVALTDGKPTGGRRWNLELMVELLVEKDRFRKVAFDSVLVDAPKGKRKAWEELAQRTGGRSAVAEME